MTRLCARPDCAHHAVATLSYDYAARTAWVDELGPEPRPSRYDLCPRHADGLVVPNGWERADRRRTRDETTAVPAAPSGGLAGEAAGEPGELREPGERGEPRGPGEPGDSPPDRGMRLAV